MYAPLAAAAMAEFALASAHMALLPDLSTPSGGGFFGGPPTCSVQGLSISRPIILPDPNSSRQGLENKGVSAPAPRYACTKQYKHAWSHV